MLNMEAKFNSLDVQDCDVWGSLAEGGRKPGQDLRLDYPVEMSLGDSS